MASNGLSLAQGKRLSFGHHNVPNASLIMEKQKATLRRSTPDSEALASSEDEPDVQQRASFNIQGQTGRSTRRPSWMNDNHHNIHRQPSLGSAELKSPGGSQHGATTADSSGWSTVTTSLGRTHSGSTTLPWTSTIWNSDSQKSLPPRFAEVLPSPTNLDVSTHLSDEVVQSPSRRESSSEASFPFAIPLQPTLKSYRSQSYSVGQLDQEIPGQTHNRPNQHGYGGRTRTSSSYSGLQHRPSRPSMLGEFSTDTALGQLPEVDDDEESTTSSGTRDRYMNTQARQIEQLAMENAILRQHAQMNQPNYTGSNASFTSTGNNSVRPPNRALQISESVLEEPDDDRPSNGEDHVLAQPVLRQGFARRRQSEFASGSEDQLTAPAPDQKQFAGGKKGHWQSSLGFGGVADIPQSRRHSFADAPVRLPSRTNDRDTHGLRTIDVPTALSQEDGFHHAQISDNSLYPPTRQLRHHGGMHVAAQVEARSPGDFSGYGQNRVNYFNQIQPHGQSLYLVTFKAARAEFYYVQEGMGLEINPGDLVIVEADRGTDLGTVAHQNIDWASARDLKEHYVAEHYNWLMMFSRQGQNGLNASANGWGPSSLTERQRLQPAVGNTSQLSPPSIEGLNVEIKPKMIKRLAQNHEIHTLREKEGNEAKAKRMCQQKVAEHHLNMEILDAEFQMDWKKLTFYYFADSYINFNSLVTDLFKIYKTRIWMSAINPASFVSATAGPHLPIGLSNLAVGTEGGHFTESRSGNDVYLQPSSPPEATYDQAWRSPHDSGTGVGSLGPYGQSWVPTTHRTVHLPHDLSRGNTLPFGHNSNLSGPSYYPRSSRNPHTIAEYQDEEPTLSYGDQVQKLQGLSLGPL